MNDNKNELVTTNDTINYSDNILANIYLSRVIHHHNI